MIILRDAGHFFDIVQIDTVPSADTVGDNAGVMCCFDLGRELKLLLPCEPLSHGPP